MELLGKLRQEVCFWRCLYQHQISTQMCADLIEKRKFFKLRQVFRIRCLPDDLWRKLLECGDGKTINRYLLYYDYASQVGDVLRLPEQQARRLRLRRWIQHKLIASGLDKNDYLFLIDCASFKLQTNLLFVRQAVLRLNHYLHAFSYTPIVHYPSDIWADIKGNCQMMMWKKEDLLFCPSEIITMLNKMVLDEDDVQELIKLDSHGLIDAWLSANRLREKVIQYLDKQGLAFEAKPYVSAKQKQILEQKGWNLSVYQLE